MQHHSATLDAYVESVRSSPTSLAVVLGGSVARGTERPDSDVDVHLVVTEEAFAAARDAEGLSFTTSDTATYEGGYVDVKVTSPSVLLAAAERGDEPTRAAFLGARTVWSRLDDLDATLAAIPRLPDDEWGRRRDSAVAQMRLYSAYFVPQGAALDDRYLLTWAALHQATSAGRALLAHHHVLFQGPKYLRSTISALPDVTDQTVRLFDRLVQEPDVATSTELLIAVETLVRAPLPPERTLGRYVADTELAWLWRTPSPEAY